MKDLDYKMRMRHEEREYERLKEMAIKADEREKREAYREITDKERMEEETIAKLKKFAERLMENTATYEDRYGAFVEVVECDEIDELLEEMTGENTKTELGAHIYFAKNGNVYKDKIAVAPAADVVEVVHGEWNKINRETTGLPWEWRCNQCGCPQDYNHNYCPNCGAKMDGERKE